MLFAADAAPRRFAAGQLALLAAFAELCAWELEQPRRLELRAKAAAAAVGAVPKLARE